ncbi:alpha/beta hydrolase [Terrabacter tumescens]|uniref:Alpha/beta hydrolase n=1 Tax=Terrabacter tumescens TaxID=60443 RepID=A0ABQ2I969_9MICO|nr:alpha/beta hydrolase [Terrabacter tumescens]GGN04250.1 alpha/beta hydrolase [Terrabacter tumescens]
MAVRLFMRRWGEPGALPPVLLVHATGETSADWAQVVSGLARDRLVVAVDLRGHGASPRPGSYALSELADDVLPVAASLATEHGRPADVVAHSLGGLVACLLASRRPDLVRRLVLEDVPVPHPREPRPPTRPDGELAYDWDAVLQVRAQIDDPDPRWPSIVAAVTAPTLVVWGGPSSPMPAEHVRQMAETVADGRLLRIDAGHLVHAAQPGVFTAAVRGFLAEPD